MVVLIRRKEKRTQRSQETKRINCNSSYDFHIHPWAMEGNIYAERELTLNESKINKIFYIIQIKKIMIYR